MMSPKMRTASLLGVAGLLPFFATAALACLPDDYRDHALLALLAYGGCILSFLGAVHWGFVLGQAEPAAPKASLRLAIGTLPSLIAWVGILLGLEGFPVGGIGLIEGGLLATVLIEARWTAHQLVPLAYFRLRVALSTMVILTLATVLVARILGIAF